MPAEKLILEPGEDKLLDEYVRERVERKQKEREQQNREKQNQFSITDPPLRDRGDSQAAKEKDAAASAASPLSLEIRRRLDALLKKN